MPPLLQRHAIRTKRYDQRSSHGVPPRSNNCTWTIGNRQVPNTRASTRHQHTHMANHASYTHHTNTETGNTHRTHTTPKHRSQPTHPSKPQKHIKPTTQPHPTATNTLATPSQPRGMDIHRRLAQRWKPQTRSISYPLPHKHDNLHRRIQARGDTHHHESRTRGHIRCPR